MTKLSIIIPCYNCAGTLQKAVDSIYQQEIEIEFDVTMVDDGSTDGTYALMQKLSKKYPRMRLVKHDRNRGGGAARNTAVENCDGDIIFGLDSDDILGPDFLKNMTRFWLQKRCDGVGKSKSVMFNGTDINNISYVIEHDKLGSLVTFESLFMIGNICPLTVTFLITREAFYKIGGYPTNHGFDTQGIAFRFLCNGLSAFVCPDTVYYHRVNYHESYYLREAHASRINYNFFKIFDEFMYIFNDEIKAKLLEADLFIGPDGEFKDFLSMVIEEKNIFSPNYRELIQLGVDKVAERFLDENDKYWQYWLGEYLIARGRDAEALNHYMRALRLGFNYRIIYIKILEASLKLSSMPLPVEDVLTELAKYISPIQTKPDPVNSLSLRKIIKLKILNNKLLKDALRKLAAIRNRMILTNQLYK